MYLPEVPAFLSYRQLLSVKLFYEMIWSKIDV